MIVTTLPRRNAIPGRSRARYTCHCEQSEAISSSIRVIRLYPCQKIPSFIRERFVSIHGYLFYSCRFVVNLVFVLLYS